jgi:hypothetical protein
MTFMIKNFKKLYIREIYLKTVRALCGKSIAYVILTGDKPK